MGKQNARYEYKLPRGKMNYIDNRQLMIIHPFALVVNVFSLNKYYGALSELKCLRSLYYYTNGHLLIFYPAKKKDLNQIKYHEREFRKKGMRPYVDYYFANGYPYTETFSSQVSARIKNAVPHIRWLIWHEPELHFLCCECNPTYVREMYACSPWLRKLMLYEINDTTIPYEFELQFGSQVKLEWEVSWEEE